ncbi:MAG: DUF3122 domain-containing protein [Cyanobacteria bacterium P01_D01_bin.14]
MGIRFRGMRFRGIQWIALTALMLLLGGGLGLPAQALPLASLHTYHERPEQTTLRSRQSFRDRTDRAWQTILFKRYDGSALQGLYLRVVGFPGVADIDPERPLQIQTGTALQWQCPPELDPQTPALPSNTAQYSVFAVFDELQKDIPLDLVIPLRSGRSATVVIPPYGVSEWRQLAAQSPQ